MIHRIAKLFAAVALVSLFLAADTTVQARGSSQPRKGKPGEPTVVSAVDCSANTITAKHGTTTTTYTVNKFTTITVNGKTADLTAIKPGMNIVINGSGSGGTVATRIDAGGAGKDPSEDKPAAKKK